MNIKQLLRKNIRNLQAYSSARDEFKGEASVYLDANESPYNSPYNRYPDPLQWELKEKIAEKKGVATENIFLGNGSDEAIDLLYRAFCEPRIDNVLAVEPTYGMYKVCADINDVAYRRFLLDDDFDFKGKEILSAIDEQSKIVWFCSPNNPTGNSLNSAEIELVLRKFKGIVVVDEAYIDFSSQKSFLEKLSIYPNLVVLQTFSKAWASAAIRLGMAFASKELIDILNKIKYPYNINILTQQKASEILEKAEETSQQIATLLETRQLLIEKLGELAMVKQIYPTDANFVLAKLTDANAVYKYLIDRGVIVRNRSGVSLCLNCLRITIGTPEEISLLLEELKTYNQKQEQ